MLYLTYDNHVLTGNTSSSSLYVLMYVLIYYRGIKIDGQSALCDRPGPQAAALTITGTTLMSDSRHTIHHTYTWDSKGNGLVIYAIALLNMH